MTFECPQCNKEMKQKVQRMAVFELCSKCKGVWVTKQMYSRIENSMLIDDRHPLKPSRLYDRVIKCPDCKLDMKQGIVDNVTLDHCPVCMGVWFDEGEFEKVFDFNPETGSYTWTERVMRVFGRFAFGAK